MKPDDVAKAVRFAGQGAHADDDPGAGRVRLRAAKAFTAAEAQVAEAQAAEAQVAEVAGIPNALAFADASMATLGSMMAAPSARTRGFASLALLGGGSDGVYGAGVLKGWSESGTCPEFGRVANQASGRRLV